ncbi:MAG TPA: hypothetical protein VFV99_03555 [Kofleriaceae bacterium]|nr:hypothetical protein [Kofleriaceae bacterium]
MLLTLPAAACIEPSPDITAVDQYDWAQYEGQRDTRMVQYTGTWSSSCQYNTRFGCGSALVHVSIRVRPAEHADLAWKRVGVVYHTPDDRTERTAVGSYSKTLTDGDEEWTVSFYAPSSDAIVVFDAWYQDGAGKTWIDDNAGELHVVNVGPAYQVVRVEPWLNTVTVGANGVTGNISLQLADLDYDKQLELVATKDHWQTTLHFGMGEANEKNKLHWVEDFPYSPGRERWQIELDVPGGSEHFEYALVYRHGVVNGARTYEFWDNNGGGNYRVEAAILQ